MREGSCLGASFLPMSGAESLDTVGGDRTVGWESFIPLIRVYHTVILGTEKAIKPHV